MSRAATSSTDWVLHGARMRIRSGSSEAMEYIRSHLQTSRAKGEPHIHVKVDWKWGKKPKREDPSDEAEKVGKTLSQEDGVIHWSRVPGFDGLTMDAGSGKGGALSLTSTCGYEPRDAISKMRYMRSGRRDRKTHRIFFKLLYYTAYYPMIWHLERSRGWGLLHASALELDGHGILLAGHGGVGKSTLALSLMADPSFKFVSDNLVLYDTEHVYSLPEPIRLDASSSRAVREAGFVPADSEVPVTAHKKPTYWVAPERLAEKAKASKVVILRFTPRPLVRPLSPAETLAQLVAARDLAREIEGYRNVAAFLSMSVADDSDIPMEPASLAGFVKPLEGYILGIGKGEPVRTTLHRLREFLG